MKKSDIGKFFSSLGKKLGRLLLLLGAGILKFLRLLPSRIWHILLSLFSQAKNLRPIKRIANYQRGIMTADGGENEEYTELAVRFATAKFVILALVVLLLCGALIFGRSVVSYENFYYMLRDIGSMSSFSETRAESLNYSQSGSSQSHTIFKSGLAVLGDTELKLFTLTGRSTLTEGVRFTNPEIEASDNFVLVYDRGGYSYSLYNSFEQVKSEDHEYPIAYASTSDTGRYAIVTSSGEYRSVIKIYDRDYKLMRVYNKNDHVLSAELDPDGRYLLITSLSSKDGEYHTTVTVYDIFWNYDRCSVELDDVLPYKAEFISGGRFALFCSDRVLVYGTLGFKWQEYEYGSDKLKQISVTDNGFALLLSSDELGGECRLVVFGGSGFRVRNTKIKGHFTSMAKCGQNIYLLSDEGVTRYYYPLGISKIAECDGVGGKLLVGSDRCIIVCRDSHAEYIDFENKNK